MATAISAPGKVLLAGGYLVLDRAYTGYVFGLSARIHVVVKDKDSVSGIAGAETENEIVVRSPQFLEAEWRYRYTALEGGRGVEVKQIVR
jgi:phosphomevalonate kinase